MQARRQWENVIKVLQVPKIKTIHLEFFDQQKNLSENKVEVFRQLREFASSRPKVQEMLISSESREMISHRNFNLHKERAMSINGKCQKETFFSLKKIDSLKQKYNYCEFYSICRTKIYTNNSMKNEKGEMKPNCVQFLCCM